MISDPMAGRMITTPLVIIVIAVLSHIVKKHLLSRMTDNHKIYRLRKIVNTLTYTLCLIIAVSMFSDSVGKLTVLFGVAGVGIAFALQEIIVSVAGWFSITFGNYYRTGDRIQLAGIRGDVIEIGVLRTTLMECGAWVAGDLYTGRIVRVANSSVYKEPVYNYSADFEFLWDEITIPIRPGTNIKVVQSLLEEIAADIVGNFSSQAKESWQHVVRHYRVEDAQVSPMITAHLLIDRINFILRYVVDFKKRRITQHLLTSSIIEKFEKNDPPIRLAATMVEVDRIPELNIAMRKTL